MSRPWLGLLTGPIGVGKTTVAAEVAERASRRGLVCGGFLAPALRTGCGTKVGIWGVDVRTGERRVLARSDRDLSGPRMGPYSFDASVLAWAVAVLARDLRPGAERKGSRAVSPGGDLRLPPCDLVIVDEIGKLELWRGAGLAPVLPWLDTDGAERVLLVVRIALLAQLQARLQIPDAALFQVSNDNRAWLAAQIVDEMFG